MRRSVLASVGLIALMFLVGVYLYPLMPERMAIHWGLSGEADGYGSRFMGLFFVPVITLIIFPFMLALPRLDPSGGIEGFRGGYDWFVFGFLGYMAYVYGLSLGYNLGWRFDFLRLMAPALGVLFYGIGVLMGRARLNWFVGIRTPWTLMSEEVWERTHEAGGRLFRLCGVLAFAGMLARGWLALLLTVAPALVAGVYLVYFSYSEYQKQIVEPSV
jgi:uncharacterized membrane protein